jgi:hypothetical protein
MEIEKRLCLLRLTNSSAASCFTSCLRASCASVTFGFLANRSKKQALTQCRKLLGANPASLQSPSESAKDLLLKITGIDLNRCPSCHNGTMIVVAELPPISSSSRWDSS